MRTHNQIKRLQRENAEQLDTIKKLCKDLGFPEPNEWGKSEPASNASIASMLSELYNLVSSPVQAVSDDGETVAELEEELKRLTVELEGKEKTIKEYMDNAEDYENQLKMNEAERDRVLQEFQNASQNSTTSQLQAQVNQLKIETSQLGQQSLELRSKLDAARQKLQKSHSRSQELQAQLNSIRSQISSAAGSIDIEEQIALGEDQIEELKQRINDLDRQIASYKAKNQGLRNVFSVESSSQLSHE